MNVVAYVLKLLRRRLFTYTQWMPLLGRRIVTHLPRRPQQPEVPQLSTAQRCNQDVLEEIFAQLPRADLARAARVCQAWLHPARRQLYHSLQFEAYEPFARALTDVLRDQLVLRSLVRRLVIDGHPLYPPEPSLLDWLKLLPEHSLQSVELTSMAFASDSPVGKQLPLLDFSVIHTVPHLSIRCPVFLSPDRLYKVLDMQYLESLFISIPDSTWPKTSFRNITSFPQLRRLSMWSDVYSPLIEELLLSLPSPLERFDFRSKNLGEAELVSLQNGLNKHAPHLRHVSFPGPWISNICFVDDLVSSLPSLETLVCGWALYSPQLISNLPSTMSALTLCTPHHWTIPFPTDDFAAGLEQNRSRLLRLNALTVVHNRGYDQSYDSLREVCAWQRIQFETMDDKCLYSIWK